MTIVISYSIFLIVFLGLTILLFWGLQVIKLI